jgi:hypothetical protein
VIFCVTVAVFLIVVPVRLASRTVCA